MSPEAARSRTYSTTRDVVCRALSRSCAKVIRPIEHSRPIHVVASTSIGWVATAPRSRPALASPTRSAMPAVEPGFAFRPSTQQNIRQTRWHFARWGQCLRSGV